MDLVKTLSEYLAFPSISTDSSFQEGMRGAVNYMKNLLEDLGFQADLVKTQGHPVLYGRREGPEEWPHVIFYGHYDVQPADPLALWKTDPFTPTVMEGKLYARGSADNKGPFLAGIAGLARALKNNPQLPVRISIILEGEEEIGSPSLPAFLEKHRDLLNADFVMLSDTGSQSPDQIVITTGLRGIACFEFSLIGPQSDLHSGLFGGPVVNPALAMAKVLSRVHDSEGRIAIPGFYDAVQEATEWEKEQVQALGNEEQHLAEFLGVPAFRRDREWTPFEQIRLCPTFEVNGIYGGYSGEGSKTIIPSRVTAKISCRLVPNQEPGEILKKVEAWLVANTPEGVTLDFQKGHSGPAYAVLPPQAPGSEISGDSPMGVAFAACHQAVQRVTGNAPLYLREGGSVPIISTFKRLLGLDSLMMGLFTPEDALHAPNEGMSLLLLERGAEIYQEIWEAL